MTHQFDARFITLSLNLNLSNNGGKHPFFPIAVFLLKLLANFGSRDKKENGENLSISNTEKCLSQSYLV